MIEARTLPYPFAEDVRFDLDPVYARLRADDPVCRIRLPYGGDAWLVTRYADVKTVLSDSRFSRAAAMGRELPRLTEAGTVSRPDSLVSMDPPEHTRIHRLVAKAFTPRRIELLRPRAEQIVGELLAGMLEHGSPADLVERFALPFPVTVICELLGVPVEDHDRFRAWSDAFVSTTAHTGPQIRQAAGELDAYLSALIVRRRAEPRDDLLSAMIQARDEGYELSERELVSLGVGLLVAGHETTVGQITNFTYVLLRHPEQLRLLRERPELVPAAVEELLRFIPLNNSSVTMPRVATTDLELAGVQIRKGDVVLVARPSANRDERVFAEPERLDLERESRPHLAFGHGPHYCIGAQLARMELQVALAGLLRRLPDFTLAVPDADLPWKDGVMIRGLRALPIAWRQP